MEVREAKNLVLSSLMNFSYLLMIISMDEQKEILDKTIEHWKGKPYKVDDILVVGVTIKPKNIL